MKVEQFRLSPVEKFRVERPFNFSTFVGGAVSARAAPVGSRWTRDRGRRDGGCAPDKDKHRPACNGRRKDRGIGGVPAPMLRHKSKADAGKDC